MIISIPIKLLLSAILGAIIGLQKETGGKINEASEIGGIRTLALVGLFGGLAGFFYSQHLSGIFIFSVALFGALILAYYIIGSWINKKVGITNELSVVFTFLLGFLILSEILSFTIILALSVLILLILSLKGVTQKFVGGLSGQEVSSFISYAAIALIILPFLPDSPVLLSHIPFLEPFLSGYGMGLGRFAGLEIFNPQKLWFIVALVTGIDVLGYILSKVFGKKKSFALASLIGGFISSTSTTQNLAQKSKSFSMVNSLVGAALLANLASFIQVFILVGPLNSSFLVALTPFLLAIILVAGLVALWFFRKKSEGPEDAEKKETNHRIFSLAPALKFALLIVAVKIITKVFLILFGQSGFIISSIIASFAGLDAIIINLADMAGKVISIPSAIFTFLLVNAANLLSKSAYSFFQGNKKFALKLFLSMLIIIVSSFVVFVFI